MWREIMTMQSSERSKALELARRIRKQARDDIMQFWLKNAIDEECGGYWTDLGRDGSRYGEGEKWIVVQTRTIYGMCLGYQFFGEKEFLDAAAHGVDFFCRHFYDPVNGGCFYCVSRDGRTVLDSSKQPYGTSFVSYSLAEYARLTGEKKVLELAVATHELIMDKCWDKKYGGLPNKFSDDWQLIMPIKRVDTHMHTMEGVSALYHATGESLYLDRLNMLAGTILGDIGKTGCYDAKHGCTHEMFHMDWTEAIDLTHGAVNLGHVTEAGWFISKLAAYTGNERHASLARGLVDWAIKFGFDRNRGGLYDYATPDGAIVRNTKTWWNQAELLGALAFLYRQTGEIDYLSVLEKQLAFIERDMLDPEYGEWYPQLEADGSLSKPRPGEIGRPDAKGHRAKSLYHVIQGLYHAHRDLTLAATDIGSAGEKLDWADYCL
jgi:mannobiose 2-epimerase